MPSAGASRRAWTADMAPQDASPVLDARHGAQGERPERSSELQGTVRRAPLRALQYRFGCAHRTRRSARDGGPVQCPRRRQIALPPSGRAARRRSALARSRAPVCVLGTYGDERKLLVPFPWLSSVMGDERPAWP